MALPGDGEIALPADLEIGVATSSWQIEGDVEGRGRCIWDDFADVPGTVVDGTVGAPAADHVHRLDEDLDLLAWLGVDAYRFSISWPRVQPGGRGPLAASGIDFYDRLVDGLLDRGIAPAATLYHWDLPSELQRDGGWTARDTASRFADYAAAMGDHLADRVDRWATLNEPWVAAYLGYATGIHAPGLRDAGAALQSAYHLMLGHGWAMQRLRAVGCQNTGIVLNLIPAWPEDAAAADAAHLVDALQNRFFLDLLAGRGLPEDLVAATNAITDWSFIADGDLAAIATPLDWLGENYYTVMRITVDPDAIAASPGDAAAFPGAPPFAFAPREPVTHMGWEIVPEGLIDVLRMAGRALPGVPLWVTENGAAIDETVRDGAIEDPRRIEYLREHLRAAITARAEGVDLRGYYAWSFLDNIEWAEGLTKRFGIVGVVPEDQTRIPKASAHWLRERLADRRAATTIP